MPVRNAPVPPELPDSAQLGFVSFHDPRLPSGDYRLTLTQEIGIAGKTETFDEVPPLEFSVLGPRFQLPREDVHAAWPPDGGRGPYQRTLPHLVLQRSTLPWERGPSAEPDGAHTPPWLALLVFDGKDAPRPRVTKLSAMGQGPDGQPIRCLGARSFDGKTPIGPTLEAGQHPDQSCTVIDVPWGLLRQLAPRWRDLDPSAHVRRVGRPDALPPAHVLTDAGLAALVAAARDAARSLGSEGHGPPADAVWLDHDQPPSWHQGEPMIEVGVQHVVLRTTTGTRILDVPGPRDEAQADAWVQALLPPTERTLYTGRPAQGDQRALAPRDFVSVATRMRHEGPDPADPKRTVHDELGQVGVAVARVRFGTDVRHRLLIGFLPDDPPPMAWEEQAVLIAGRLPSRGRSQTVHLVSLENAYVAGLPARETGHTPEHDALVAALDAAWATTGGPSPAEPLGTPWTTGDRFLTWAAPQTRLIELGAGYLGIRQGSTTWQVTSHAPADEATLEAWARALLPPEWRDRFFGRPKRADEAAAPVPTNPVELTTTLVHQGHARRVGVALYWRRGKGADEERRSLRALVSFLPEEPQLDGLGAADTDPIRLVSLYSWSFHTDPEAHDLQRLLMHLDSSAEGGEQRHALSVQGGDGALRLPVPDGAPDAVKARLRAGYVALPHRMRQGDRTVSWYRGPLAPWAPTAVDLPPVVRGSDQLLVVDRATGLVDTSYAAAWELGRLTALEDHAFAVDLHRWRIARTHALQRLRDLHHRSQVGVDEAGPAALPEHLATWFRDLTLLKGLPFPYLVPDERMLPLGSIRFFTVDPGWLACLRDGAFSVGRVLAADHAADAASLSLLPGIPRLSGFLLRSEVVADFPGLVVDAYASPGPDDGTLPLAVDPGPDGFVRLPRLRAERLGPDTLIALYDGGRSGLDLEMLDLHLHPQTLHFGFEEDAEGRPLKALRNPRDGRRAGLWSGRLQRPPAGKAAPPARPPIEGAPKGHEPTGLHESAPGDVLTPDALPWRAPPGGDPHTAGLINLHRLYEEVGARTARFGLDHPFSAADFALQMLDAPALVRFLRWPGPLPDAPEGAP